MYKDDEFEIAFKRICDVDISRLKEINGSGTKYFLDDTTFFILNDGTLLVSSGKSKLYLKFTSWEVKINILRETAKTVTVFISVGDEDYGVECCYESELNKV